MSISCSNPVGKALVDFYYRVSPPIAEFITEHPCLKPIVRAGLLPAVAMSTIAVNTSPAEKAAIVGLFVLVLSGSGYVGDEAACQRFRVCLKAELLISLQYCSQ